MLQLTISNFNREEWDMNLPNKAKKWGPTYPKRQGNWTFFFFMNNNKKKIPRKYLGFNLNAAGPCKEDELGFNHYQILQMPNSNFFESERTLDGSLATQKN